MAQVMMDHNGGPAVLAPGWHQKQRQGSVRNSLTNPTIAICKGLSIRVNVLIPSGMGTPVKRYMS